uniref:RUN and TBC1 domain-containing protein 3 n=1 Tax=Trichuris muris TaxID=70415 RepID=A0A5S6PZI2_TRIMR
MFLSRDIQMLGAHKGCAYQKANTTPPNGDVGAFARDEDDDYAKQPNLQEDYFGFCRNNTSVIPAHVSGDVHRKACFCDEFGFKADTCTSPPRSGLSGSKLVNEDSKLRLKWIAYFEFTFNKVVEDLTWEKVESFLPKSKQLSELVRQGVPHSLRPYVWPRLCGAMCKRQMTDFSYKDILKTVGEEDTVVFKQIEKDLLRTLPNNICFSQADCVGVKRLRQVLRALSYVFPEVGYCQGMGVIVAILLLFMEEESVFWMMFTVIEDLLPSQYYSDPLFGAIIDQKVFRRLINELLPKVHSVLNNHDIEPSLISLHWFLTLYSSSLPFPVLLRVWDMFFYEGSVVLFKVALAFLKFKENNLRILTNSAEVFNLLSELPSLFADPELLLNIVDSFSSVVSEKRLSLLRNKESDYVMANQTDGTFLMDGLPKRRRSRFLRRSQSMVGSLSSLKFRTFSHGSSLAELGNEIKNVKQTELMLQLKEAVQLVAKQMIESSATNYTEAAVQACAQFRDHTRSDRGTLTRCPFYVFPGMLESMQEEANGKWLVLERIACSAVYTLLFFWADYSVASHGKDYQTYLDSHQSSQKFARALVDFERRDEDELGFRKNDLITVISRKDEHCWIGEIKGVRGWFPAKFVELLSEQLRDYSSVQDDPDSEKVENVVRDRLCSALKAIFECGIKKSNLLGCRAHPWLFIESVAAEENCKDICAVKNRLMLCQTFQLDEDGRVLTPEELLYKAWNYVNVTHDFARASMDVKFRSLICLGLNEQVLHLWFELLCSAGDTVRRWYHAWSFIRSPGWVQVKCELRVLAQFMFYLSSGWELPANQRRLGGQPIRESVREMLVKHHLFSWEM